MSIQVEVKGDKALIKILDGTISPRKYAAALAASSNVFIGFAQVYPKQSGKPFQFVSEKQRRYVMMAIKKGIIQVPYRRKHSTGLAGGWSFDVRTVGAFMESNITNAMEYGPWVMSPQSQSRYHQGNWPVTDEIMDESIPQISRIWQRTLDGMLGGKGI